MMVIVINEGTFLKLKTFPEQKEQLKTYVIWFIKNKRSNKLVELRNNGVIENIKSIDG